MPYDKLEKALLDTIIKTCRNYLEKVNIKELSEEISTKNQNKDDNKNKISYLENKIKEYLSKIDMLYEDKFRGNISNETYKRLSLETERLLDKTQYELNKYKKIDEEPVKIKEKEYYESKIKELIDINKPTRELLQTLIERIEIDKDKNIEIFYRFKI